MNTAHKLLKTRPQSKNGAEREENLLNGGDQNAH